MHKYPSTSGKTSLTATTTMKQRSWDITKLNEGSVENLGVQEPSDIQNKAAHPMLANFNSTGSTFAMPNLEFASKERRDQLKTGVDLLESATYR